MLLYIFINALVASLNDNITSDCPHSVIRVKRVRKKNVININIAIIKMDWEFYVFLC